MALNYTCEIVIDKPKTIVAELVSNPEHFSKWQKGFIRIEPLSGDLGNPGSKSTLYYKQGKREIEMIETIVKLNLPNEFSATFESRGVLNEQHNFFHEVSPNQTKWESQNIFKMGGFFGLMGALFPGIFKRQTLSFMKDFKAFAEQQP